MENINSAIADYREKMSELKQERDQVESKFNNGDLAANKFEQQAQAITQQAQVEQKNYIEKYKQSLSDEMEEVKNQVASSELPSSVASLKSLKSVNDTELQILADKHKENYFAQKAIKEIAKDRKQLNVKTYGFDVKDKLGNLKTKKNNASSRFNLSDPLKDAESSRLATAFGLEGSE